MKKQLISVVCVLLAVCMFAACSAGPSSTAQPKDYVQAIVDARSSEENENDMENGRRGEPWPEPV